jgi:hypothetical protein
MEGDKGAGRLIHTSIFSSPPELTKLTALIESLDTPEDNSDYHTWLSRCWLTPQSAAYPIFKELVDYFMEETGGHRKEPHKTNLRRHWEIVLLNLSRALFQRHWLLVPMDNRAFKHGSIASEAGFSYGPMQVVIKYLHNQRWIKLKKGKRYKDQPTRTRIFPEKALNLYLTPLFLDSAEPFEAPYLTVGEASDRWRRVVGDLPQDHPEILEMNWLNEYLEQHRWACKAPVYLRYKKDFLHGGRLYTPFQNLPDKRVRLRINTQIDQEAICEVDFSANHLRMQLANLYGIDAGDTPYEDIGELASETDRSVVKAFITRAMGASDRASAANSLREQRVTNARFEALEAATYKRFSGIKLFDAWTHQAQNLEGQILKKIMLQGVEKDIVCLPVHDAVAVQQRHEQWAVEAMISTWSEVVCSDVKPRVKVDRAGG